MSTGMIYCAHNIHTGKKYIGKTIRTLEERIYEHYKNSAKKNFKFYNSLRKPNNHFIWGIIEECDYKIINEREIFWIKYFDTYNFGYNSTLGGEGGIHPSKCKKFILKSPNGEIFEGVNIKKFCKNNNLSPGEVSKVILGKRQSHKGWTLPETKLTGHKFRVQKRWKEFKLISPNGILYEGKNMKEFCKNNNLIPACISEVISGKRKQHKGWRAA